MKSEYRYRAPNPERVTCTASMTPPQRSCSRHEHVSKSLGERRLLGLMQRTKCGLVSAMALTSAPSFRNCVVTDVNMIVDRPEGP
eukprot:10753_6